MVRTGRRSASGQSPDRACRRRPDSGACGRSAGRLAGLAYFRWHGAPRVYYSDYDDESLDRFSRQMEEEAASGAEVWGIFDNTAAGHALGNALKVDAMMAQTLEGQRPPLPCRASPPQKGGRLAALMPARSLRR
ncbi:DUF72 domain-containing protein [Mesorhizobium sp. B2-1-8]|uniref:DUF72 domain-containing protein n=1 Tax=Mesorhizobium sp. B2-1-8 TaxID=2589967 RepID=UPI0039F0A10C